MTSECKTVRAELLGADPEALRSCAHLEVCAECARWVGGLERREAALADLTRLPAPFALDGGVVQALQAGFRQDRAVRALSALERTGSPPELTSAVDLELGATDGWRPDSEGPAGPLPAARRLGAPAVLAELVNEELGDPAGHRARRFVGSLARQSAPEELAERLVRDGWRRPGRRSRAFATLAAGTGLALAAVLLFTLLQPTASQPAPWNYDFVVETVESPAQMVGFGAGLADAASGGMLSARSL